jgi:hypothetical protein
MCFKNGGKTEMKENKGKNRKELLKKDSKGR